jgi:tetratricopeptide (TPR) repeat protein
MTVSHEHCPDCGQWKVQCSHCNGSGHMGDGHFGAPRCLDCEGAGAKCPDATRGTGCGRLGSNRDVRAADSERANSLISPTAAAEPVFSVPSAGRDPSLVPPEMRGYRMPPDGLVVTLMATAYAAIHAGEPARHCIDACRVLHYAYAQFGIRSELRAVVLTIRADDGRAGRTPVPSWNGSELAGHAILCLPDAGRLVDATVDQFPWVGGTGPLVGGAGPLAGGATPMGDQFSAGSSVLVRRGDLTLVYTICSDETTRLILDRASVSTVAEEYRNQGIQLASTFLAGLAESPPTAAQARQAPYPRLAAYLDAIEDATIGHDDDGFWYVIPPSTARLRLDEILLPAGTPGPAPEDFGPVSPREESAAAAFATGMLLQERGDIARAKAMYERAIGSGHPEAVPRAAVCLGDLLTEEGDTAGAKAMYDRAIGSGHPEAAADALVSLGDLLKDEGDTAGATAAYHRASYCQDPGTAANALDSLGELLEEEGDIAAAEAAYRRAIDLGHSEWSPAAALHLGNLFEDQGNIASARAAYQSVVDSGHDILAQTAAIRLGKVLTEEGEVNAAEAAYQWAVDRGGSKAACAAVRLGELLDSQGDIARARAAYGRAVGSGDMYWASAAAVRIGDQFKAQGDIDSAKAAYQYAVDSGNPEMVSIAVARVAELGD